MGGCRGSCGGIGWQTETRVNSVHTTRLFLSLEGYDWAKRSVHWPWTRWRVSLISLFFEKVPGFSFKLHSTSFRHLRHFFCSLPTSSALLSSPQVCAVDGWWARRRRPAFIHHCGNGGGLARLSSLTEDHKWERGDGVAVWRAVGEQSVKALWWLPEFPVLLEELCSFTCGGMSLENIKSP